MTVRRERERERHRQEILEATLKLLEERGPHGLTMDEVARRSEFAVGSIYRHFGSKDELVVAVVRQHLGPYFAEVTRLAEAEGRFEDLLDGLLAAYVSTVRDTRAVWRALMLLRNEEATAMGEFVEPFIAYVDSLAALLERGQAEGVIIEEDPWHLVTALDGMLTSFVKRSVLGLDVDFEAATRVIRRAVLVGMAPDGASRSDS